MGLHDIYYAKQQIAKSLPSMIEQSTNRDLSAGLSAHLEETRKQIGRLGSVLKKLGKQPKGEKCPAIDGGIAAPNERSATKFGTKWFARH